MFRRNPDVIALVVLLAGVFLSQAIHRVLPTPSLRLGIHSIGDPLREARGELKALRAAHLCRQ